jgi:hypothetical protein
MQRMEVSGAIQHIYIYVVRRQRVKRDWRDTSAPLNAFMAWTGTNLPFAFYLSPDYNLGLEPGVT